MQELLELANAAKAKFNQIKADERAAEASGKERQKNDEIDRLRVILIKEFGSDLLTMAAPGYQLSVTDGLANTYGNCLQFKAIERRSIKREYSNG